MARVRILSDDELVRSIKTKFKESKDVMDRLSIEIEACRHIYQGITNWKEGGLDSGLLTQSMAPRDDQSTSSPIEGLDLIKAVLFLHSKMCVSEPVVTCNASNQDQSNKKAAECAQSYIPFFKKHTNLQEKLEAGPYLGVSVYGNGIIYIGWDDNGGNFPLDDIPENQDITTVDFKMEGDFDVRVVPVRKFYIDANSKHGLVDAKHCFEEREIEFQEALFTFDRPDEQERIREEHERSCQPTLSDMESADSPTPTTVTIYEYWEKGMPWNGFLGSRVFFVNPLEPRIIRRENHPYKHKKLPYAMITDVDIPDNAYGMSRIIYAWQVQKSIDTILSLIMDNIALHGSAKFYTPEGATNEDGTDNDPASIGTYNPSSGGQPIQFRPANVTSDVWKGYEILRGMLNNLYGMNEFSQGQIPRELSSYAVQLALEMDDKYRIRLFNKKKQFLRDLYWMGLELTKQYMTDQRKLAITGVEGFSNDEYFSAAKLEGDYSIDVDYGQYIPVDPAAKKQQLLEFIKSGFFEKAGGDMKKIAPLLVDGTMLDVKDMFEKATKLQLAEIDKIINGEEVNVRKWDKHEAHAKAIDDYVNTETFEALDDEIKERIWAHGENHTNALAEQLAKSQPPPGGGGAPGGLPPGLSEMLPEMPPTKAARPSPEPITQPTGPIL